MASSNGENRRRPFLKALAAGSVGALAGCAGDGGGDGGTPTPTPTEAAERPGPEEGVEYEKVGPLEYTGVSKQYAPKKTEIQSLAVEDIEKLGVEINVNQTSFAKLAGKWVNANYDLMTLWMAETADKLDGMFKLYFNVHSKFSQGDGENNFRYESAEYDQAVENFMFTTSQDDRVQAGYECQNIIARDQHESYISHGNFFSAADKDKWSNWKPMKSSWTFWNVANLDSIEPKTDDRTVVYATGKEPPSINPTAVQANASMQGTDMQFTHLARWNSDGQAEPFAAKTIEFVDDTTVEAVLHEGLTTHDGKPYTAEDVKFTFDYYKKWKVPYLAAYYNSADSVEVIDEHTVHFHLPRPNYSFTTVVLAEMPLIPKHIWEGAVEENDLEHPRQWQDTQKWSIGAGPLKLVTYEPQNKIVFEPHEGHPLTDFSFDTLVWKIYGSNTVAFSDLMQGNASFVHELLPTQYAKAKDNDSLLTTRQQGFDMTGVFHQCKRIPMADRAWRQAVSYAIDKQNIIDTVLQGMGDKAVHPMAPVNEQYYNPDTDPDMYSEGVSGGVRVLKEAGYRWDEDGNLLYPVDRFKDNQEDDDINPYGNPRGCKNAPGC